jgi:hypothetical protein
MKQTTEELFLTQIEEVLEKNDVKDQIKKLSVKLLRSGALERTEVETSLRPAKCALAAIFDHLSYQFTPSDQKGKDEVENLKFFT